MPKRVKIVLYVILILAIISVVWLMAGNRDVDTEVDTNIDALTGETIDQTPENMDVETPTFEEDVMNDLEGFFGTNNGYEDVEGEYGFNTPEDE